MNELRNRLREITQNGRPDTHRALIDVLRTKSPHAIQMLERPASAYDFNCVMYAFGLIDHEQYIQFAMDCPASVHASPDFVRFLIESRHLIEHARPRTQHLVVYLDAGAVRHIGRLCAKDRVRSKWGVGHLYEHGMFEVPAQYGEEVRFFRPIEVDAVLDHFLEYASSRGVRLRRSGVR